MPISNETVTIIDASGASIVVSVAAAIPSSGVMVMGSDGTDSRFLSTDTSGRAVVVGAGVAGTPVGGVISIQGVSGGTALPVSGTVTATIAQTDATATGALGALNAAVQVTTAGLVSVGMQLAAGTLIGTIVAEVSFDGGTTWNPTYFNPSNGATSLTIVFASANTATAATLVGVGGSGLTRVRVSAYTSGTANITIRASVISDPSSLTAGAPGSAAPLYASQLAGTDGTDLRAILTDNTGRPIVVGAGTAGTATGGVLTIQGVAGGTTLPVTAAQATAANLLATVTQGPNATLANAWSIKVTDATNGPAAVKAASTAAAATDPSLVVSLSPNSPVKATVKPLYGTNNQALTITLVSLANAAARASTAVDNTTNLFEDALIFVKLETAAAGTSATGYANIFAYATVDNGTTYSENVTGTDAAITLVSPTNLILVAQVNLVANAVTYRAGPYSFCRSYGLDRLPAKWGIVVQNESGAALNATAGNQAITWQGVNGQFQ